MWLKAISKYMVRKRRFVVVVVFPEPTSDGVDDDFTAVLGSERQLCRSEVPCHAFGNSSQQGGRCETSKSFSDGYWLVAVVLLPQSCERGTGGLRHDGAWNVALGRGADSGAETKIRFSNFGGRPPLMCCGWTADGVAAESGANDSGAFGTNVSEEALAKETGAIGTSLLLGMLLFEVAGDGLATLSKKKAGGSSSRAKHAVECWPSLVVARSSLR